MSDDLISRQAAIDLIENESRKWGDEYGVSDVLCDLSDMPSVQPETRRWIPCSEILPKEKGTYLTTTIKGAVRVNHFHGKQWGYSNDAVAWMPLPEPWKGEDNANVQRN